MLAIQPENYFSFILGVVSKMKLNDWFLAFTLLFLLSTSESLERLSKALELLANQEEEDIIPNTCETQQSTIHVNKEEYDEVGSVVRSCSGDVLVTKCEGTCSSQVEPSVVMPTGFTKSCQCCRETWMTQKETRLTDCYDSNGQKIYGELGTMIIFLKEPDSCACHICG
ncbi:partner of bursicon-like [Centruroides sculpturatus]|uniref:partner of bursicon-like n=1 Tax=Centruroides sculpturatus TaxID=218467 RepID=UPI000C6E17B6|nr:partner of bursicon-like [Centruroides sculpturatus]